MVPAKTVKRKGKKAKSTNANGSHSGASSAVVELVEPTVTDSAEEGFSVYEKAVKEVVALAENDQFARKIDTSPLNEARGKDTWHLHVQLRMLEEMTNLFQDHASRIQESLATIDTHVHTNTAAVAELVDRRGNEVVDSVGEFGTKILSEFGGLQKAITDVLTAGFDEIHANLQEEITAKLEAQQEAYARLIDRRFNQTDVAFASVRADVEVVKSLLTDIIKARIGRVERNQD